MASHSNLAHSEMWDDSALVNSWNEALEEYKHYHSIHARGERVEDVLREAAGKSKIIEPIADSYGEEVNGQRKDDLNAKMDINEEIAHQAGTPVENGSTVDKAQQSDSNQASTGRSSKGLALPQNLIGQVHDESLKNLLMSWYYAGYYTGLHEGQQQGVASKGA